MKKISITLIYLLSSLFVEITFAVENLGSTSSNYNIETYFCNGDLSGFGIELNITDSTEKYFIKLGDSPIKYLNDNELIVAIKKRGIELGIKDAANTDLKIFYRTKKVENDTISFNAFDDNQNYVQGEYYYRDGQYVQGTGYFDSNLEFNISALCSIK